MHSKGNAKKLSKLLNLVKENFDANAAVVVLLREKEQKKPMTHGLDRLHFPVENAIVKTTT